MKWLDSRLFKPSCNAADMYPVIFQLCSDISTRGYATWMPNDGYRDGEWKDVQNTNGNPKPGCEVLYWHEHLAMPETVKKDGSVE